MAAFGLLLALQVVVGSAQPSETVVAVAAEANKDPAHVHEALRVQDLPDEHAREYLMAVGDLERPRPVAPAAPVAGVWSRLAACESGGRWNIATGNGYYGGLQFDRQTWAAYGGHAYASNAHLATPAQQVAVAERLRAARGFQPWPACSRRLGLR